MVLTNSLDETLLTLIILLNTYIILKYKLQWYYSTYFNKKVETILSAVIYPSVHFYVGLLVFSNKQPV